MGEGVNAKNNTDFKALIEAVQNKDTNTVRLLIEDGADVNAKDGEGQTPLIFAAITNAADIVKILISAKADVNAKNGYDWTALMAASGNDATDVARFLIEAGADVDAKNECGWTALMVAARQNATGVAKVLIEAKADLNAKTNDGRTALMFAAYENATGVAKILIEAEADLNAKTNDGRTALMFAAYKNATDVAKVLIEAKADLNAKTNDGRTVLMFAVDNNAVCVADLIVEAANRRTKKVCVVVHKNKVDSNTLNNVDSFRRFDAEKSPMEDWQYTSLVTLNGREFYGFGVDGYSDSYREQDGYALVLGCKLHYWLYDTYAYHDGDDSEILDEIIPRWVEDMGYVIDFDDIKTCYPNTNLANSVKALMKQRRCDVSVTLITHESGYPTNTDYVVINSYDKSEDMYFTTIYYLCK